MIALIDYGAGNVASVANALKVLGHDFIITRSQDEIEKADKIIFPGVGEASYAMGQLENSKLIPVLKTTGKPLLGICLGMQLLAGSTEEGDTNCLGIIEGKVKKFDAAVTRVPHMGWNSIEAQDSSGLFKDIKDVEYFYFANSYYLPVGENTSSICENVIKFSASIKKDNFYGVQFHPEKSGEAGLKILRNFTELC